MGCKRGYVTAILFQFQLLIAMVHIQVRKYYGTIVFMYDIIKSCVGITVCSHGMALLASLMSTFNRISFTNRFGVITTGDTQLVGFSTLSIMSLAIRGCLQEKTPHRREFHTGMTQFWFRIAFTWWLGHFISCYLTVHFMLIKYTFGSKSQTLRMRYPFQSTGRPISHRNGWSFRVYMIPLRDFVPERNSRPGARTGVNSRRGDSCRHNILWWYHVNKYRATRGNRSELAPGRKSPQCHVNTP